MPERNSIYSVNVPSDQTGIYLPLLQQRLRAQAGAAEQTSKKKGDKKAAQKFKKAKNQSTKQTNKTPRQQEEQAAQTRLDSNMIDLGNGVKVSPHDLYEQTHPGTISAISEDQWKNSRSNAQLFKEWLGIKDGDRYDPNAPAWKRAFDNALSLGKNENVFTGLKHGFVEPIIGTTVAANPLAATAFVAGYEGLNQGLPLLWGSDKSLAGNVAHVLPFANEEGINNTLMLALAGGKPAFNKGMQLAGEAGWKPGQNYTLSRILNNAVKGSNANTVDVYPDYKWGSNPSNIITESYVQPWKKTLKSANKAYIDKLKDPEAVSAYNPVKDYQDVVNPQIPRGHSGVYRIHDSRNPNQFISDYKVFNNGQYTTEYNPTGLTATTQRLYPTRNVSGGKYLKQYPFDVQDDMTAYLTRTIDPKINKHMDPNNYQISTASSTDHNMNLLNTVVQNLRSNDNVVEHIGMQKAFVPGQIKKVDVPVYGNKPTPVEPTQQTPEPALPQEPTAPNPTIQAPTTITDAAQGRELAQTVKQMYDQTARANLLKQYYPQITDKEATWLAGMVNNYQPGSWFDKIGYHPLTVENARLIGLTDRRGLAQDFNPTALGYPENTVEQIGQVTKYNNQPVWGDYNIMFKHPDGTQAGIYFDNTYHAVRPVLRPGDTGEVNKGTLLPMMREMKKIVQNPNFKGWMVGNDYSGSFSPVDLTTGGTDTFRFGTNGYSLDSNELLYNFARKNNLNVYNPVSVQNFNNLAFKNRAMQDALNIGNAEFDANDNIEPLRTFYREQFVPYQQKIGGPAPLFGNQSGVILGGTPIIGLKKGSKLIRRK